MSAQHCKGEVIAKSYDKAKAMRKWELGALTGEQELALFQRLIDSGDVWQLGSSYSHTAACLIHAGLCKAKYR